jgi:hypothetical protein
MRIFNYSDKPVLINGIPHNEMEINIPSEEFSRDMLGHHTKTFINLEQHHYLTIWNISAETYNYSLTEHELPNISTFSFILVTTIALHILIKIIQKVRQA